MDEYIEREAAINEQKRFRGYLDNDMLTRLEIATKRIPAADVQPVRHGRWGHRLVCSNMTGYEYACSCSECGKPTYRISILEDMPPYCPNCGAKMDGGDTSERQAMAVQSQND